MPVPPPAPDFNTPRWVKVSGVEWIGLYALIPLSVGSLLSGVVQAFGTDWGLVDHYWVVAKLMINILSSVILAVFVRNLAAGAYADGPAPLVHAAVALVLLLLATLLSVYKPRGLTRHGWRRLRARTA